ncbi:unnamed protein product [Cyprideis torosa]|uniref:Uncharacterized protein n=1 Tax=Cyprideis torosa TaxID=163714 RepID=A0A7R8ZTU5_9CRUS|nr:unnamed protein product [Cyprideis torosa]CAG0898932.1 unnamed protein product [Cyprideis torosa]
MVPNDSNSCPPGASEFVPLFCRGSRSGSWVSLLEKAYAKLNGGYSQLSLVPIQDALVEMSGGGCLTSWPLSPGKGAAILDNNKENQKVTTLFKKIQVALRLGACLLVPNGPSSQNSQPASQIRDGNFLILERCMKSSMGGGALMMGSLMALTGNRVKAPGGNRRHFVLLRDPNWEAPAQDTESESESEAESRQNASSSLAGSSSHLLPHWCKLSREEMKANGLQKEPGTVWVAVSDFQHCFASLVVLLPGSHPALRACVHGRWEVGVIGSRQDRSGGSMQYPATILRNPQYLLDVPPASLAQGRSFARSAHCMTDVMLQLVQKSCFRSEENQEPELELFCMGMAVTKVEINRSFRLRRLLTPVTSSVYDSTRAVTFNLTALTPGRYIVLPTTFEPLDRGDFLLRSWGLRLREVQDEAPPLSTWRRLFHRFQFASQLIIRKWGKATHVPSLTVTIECEKQVLRSQSVPSGEIHAVILLRETLRSPIRIQAVSRASSSSPIEAIIPSSLDSLDRLQEFTLNTNEFGRTLEVSLRSVENPVDL